MSIWSTRRSHNRKAAAARAFLMYACLTCHRAPMPYTGAAPTTYRLTVSWRRRIKEHHHDVITSDPPRPFEYFDRWHDPQGHRQVDVVRRRSHGVPWFRQADAGRGQGEHPPGAVVSPVRRGRPAERRDA